MKKIQLLLTFFAAALVFGLIGCQKDVEASMSITETNSATSARRVSLFDSQPVIEHADIMAKIEAFKTRLAKIENGILSPKDIPMTVEEAIWNIEALSNARYCQAQLPFQDLISQKATLEIPLNDKGKIDNQALLALDALRIEVENADGTGRGRQKGGGNKEAGKTEQFFHRWFRWN